MFGFLDAPAPGGHARARYESFLAEYSQPFPPVHQGPLENWRDGTASALGHVPELGRTPEYEGEECARCSF